MHVFQVEGSVHRLRFLPDGRLLVQGQVIEVRSLRGGDPVRLAFPVVSAGGYSHYPNPLAVSPSGDRCYIARGRRLYACRTDDGSLVDADGELPGADEVIASPVGDRLVTLRNEENSCVVTAYDSGRLTGGSILDTPYHRLAGFMPDGNSYATIEGRRTTVRAFGTGNQLASATYPSRHVNHPQTSPDGRHLGVIGYGSMYVYDLTALGRPRVIKGGQTFGNFVSFAFHPGGRTLAVIHGGPTLVKLYDLDTLKLRQRLTWKLGPLGCVAFSPDGLLGAAGSDDGRVVVWDVDE